MCRSTVGVGVDFAGGDRSVVGPAGEQNLAEGCGLVGVSGRRGPGVAAVGVLNIGPAAVFAGLKGSWISVVGSAFRSEVAGVGWLRQARGSGVVEVAIVGCYSAAGEHAHEVAHSDASTVKGRVIIIKTKGSSGSSVNIFTSAAIRLMDKP